MKIETPPAKPLIPRVERVVPIQPTGRDTSAKLPKSDAFKGKPATQVGGAVGRDQLTFGGPEAAAVTAGLYGPDGKAR